MSDPRLTPARVAEYEENMLERPTEAYAILRTLILEWQADQKDSTDHAKAHKLALLVEEKTGVPLHWNSAYYHAGAGTRAWATMKLETGLALLRAIKLDVEERGRV